MPNVKTAVSIEKPLFDEAEKLARQMAVTRSHLYTLALESFIEKRKTQQMLAQLDRVYGEDPLTAEEGELLERMRRQQRHLQEEEW